MIWLWIGLGWLAVGVLAAAVWARVGWLLRQPPRVRVDFDGWGSS